MYVRLDEHSKLYWRISGLSTDEPANLRVALDVKLQHRLQFNLLPDLDRSKHAGRSSDSGSYMYPGASLLMPIKS